MSLFWDGFFKALLFCGGVFVGLYMTGILVLLYMRFKWAGIALMIITICCLLGFFNYVTHGGLPLQKYYLIGKG